MLSCNIVCRPLIVIEAEIKISVVSWWNFTPLVCMKTVKTKKLWEDFLFFRDPLLIFLGRGFTLDRFEKPDFITNWHFYLLLFAVEPLKGLFFLLNSGIFVFGEYYLNLPNSNQQKATRTKSSCYCKIPICLLLLSNNGIVADRVLHIIKPVHNEAARSPERWVSVPCFFKSLQLVKVTSQRGGKLLTIVISFYSSGVENNWVILFHERVFITPLRWECFKRLSHGGGTGMFSQS